VHSAPLVPLAEAKSDASETKQRQDWEIPWKSIVLPPHSLIGEGYFGQVYKGKWAETVVAVKKVRPIHEWIESCRS
jgi:hypothetical protein